MFKVASIVKLKNSLRNRLHRVSRVSRLRRTTPSRAVDRRTRYRDHDPDELADTIVGFTEGGSTVARSKASLHDAIESRRGALNGAEPERPQSALSLQQIIVAELRTLGISHREALAAARRLMPSIARHTDSQPADPARYQKIRDRISHYARRGEYKAYSEIVSEVTGEQPVNPATRNVAIRDQIHRDARRGRYRKYNQIVADVDRPKTARQAVGKSFRLM